MGNAMGVCVAVIFYAFLFMREGWRSRYVIKHQGKFEDLIDPELKRIFYE